ncbi:MAG: hypothetical protein IPJ17_09960 [Holophagales bacterium]|nr:MAG: hypothetical protein IPJ17_09960 [Holophagales bacterium]
MIVDVTPRQLQYLAFIAQYLEVAGVAPSEGDIAEYFGVSGPSAHQMVVTLETKGLLARLPGRSRSIRLLVSRGVLPVVGEPGKEAPSRHTGMASFALALAKRFATSNAHSLARFASVLRLAYRVEELLLADGAGPRVAERARKAVQRIADSMVGESRRSRRPASAAEVRRGPAPAPSPKKPRREVPPEQRDLF